MQLRAAWVVSFVVLPLGVPLARPAFAADATEATTPAPGSATASQSATGSATPPSNTVSADADGAPDASASDGSAPDAPSADEAVVGAGPPPVADPTEPAAPDESPPPAAEPPPEPLAVATTSPPPPKPPSPAGPFAQGRIRVGGMIGLSSTIGGASSRTWFILGVGAGYHVLDGLEPHADTTFWIGDPFLATLTPGLRYTFHMVPVVKPYVGTFYRHYFVSGPLSDTDSLGARAGVNFMLNEFSYVAGGVVYEHFLDDALFEEPDQVYPELMISVSF